MTEISINKHLVHLWACQFHSNCKHSYGIYRRKYFKLSLDYNIIFYFRYVDDTLICPPINKINNLLEKINKADNNLKFTLKIAVQNKIKIWSGKFLNFHSHHPL